MLLPLVSLSLAGLAAAAPLHRTRQIGSGVDVLLFDAPAVVSQNGTVASAEAFTFSAGIDTSDFGDVLSPLLAPLKLLGIDADAALDTALNRTRLFAVAPEGGQAIKIAVEGCSQPGALTATDDDGLAFQNVKLGKCGAGESFAGQISGTNLKANASGDASMTVFPSEDGGFGVISDIDDTTKITNVLDKFKAAKATLFDDPQPVAGMPALYANLSKSLDNPSFTFVTGSPYQLVPFLRDFIHTTYAASPGAILAKNLTLTDPAKLIDTLLDGNSTQEHKLAQIQRLHDLWPKKQFLAIGDSGERDPETYGEAFRTHGPDVIKCIWIRRIDDGDNSDARFQAAFDGVPTEKIRVYNDDDIVNVLPKIDVAGGKC